MPPNPISVLFKPIPRMKGSELRDAVVATLRESGIPAISVGDNLIGVESGQIFRGEDCEDNDFWVYDWFPFEEVSRH